MSLIKPNSLQILCDVSLKSRTGFDYHVTPISETPMAIESDPFRYAGRLPDNWWSRTEPREADGREMLRLLDRASKSLYGRDHAKRRRRATDRVEHEHETRVANDDDVSEYLPEKSQTLGEWVAELAKDMDMTGVKKLLFDALRGFCERFGNRQYGELADDERSAITSFVRLLHRGAEAA